MGLQADEKHLDPKQLLLQKPTDLDLHFFHKRIDLGLANSFYKLIGQLVRF